MEHLR